MANAGWYPDNNDPTTERYWDGATWTLQTRPKAEQTMPLQMSQPAQGPAHVESASRPRWYSKAWVVAPVVGLVGFGIGAAAASGGAAADSAQPTTTVTVTQKATATVEVTPPPVRVTVTESASAPASASSSATSQVGDDSKPAASDDSFAMPDEVGKGLQAAQDDLQAVSGDPLYISLSRDALGAHRFQILDSDWKVCSQNVPAGTAVTPSMMVRFGAVKLDESCP